MCSWRLGTINIISDSIPLPPQAVLIHGADSMGGSFVPDGERGFGRVLLNHVLPRNGEGAIVMFFNDEGLMNAGNTTDYKITASKSAL